MTEQTEIENELDKIIIEYKKNLKDVTERLKNLDELEKQLNLLDLRSQEMQKESKKAKRRIIFKWIMISVLVIFVSLLTIIIVTSIVLRKIKK